MLTAISPTLAADIICLRLRYAFAALNFIFFGGRLPPCTFFLHRKEDVMGCFRSRRFHGHDQIGINPDFLSRPLMQTISTLAHECVHLWQYERGTITTVGFHNQEWANRMISMGLQPSDTGYSGGNQVGADMTHYVIPNGPFDVAVKKLIASGFTLPGASS